MAQQKQVTYPFNEEIRDFRTMNQRDSPVTMVKGELPICQNFMPIGSSLWTVPGYSEVKASMGTGETAWLANTAYALDAVRRPSTANGCIYKVTVNGTSHATTEPVWPTTQDATITDGTVTWKCYRLDILRAYDFNLAGVIYKIVVCGGSTTGSVTLYKVASSSNWAQTRINIPGKAAQDFTSPRMDQWKNTNIVIGDTVGGYFTYDGTNLTQVDDAHVCTDVCVFDGRVWTINGLTIQYTAIGSITDFSGTGSGSFIDTNSDTRIALQRIVAGGTSMFAVGDHSTHLVGGSQVLSSGNTAYNLTDAVPGVGSVYPDTCAVMGSLLFSMSDNGVNQTVGQSFDTISELLNQLIPKIDTTFSPSACFGKIYNKYVYCILVRGTNPLTGNTEKFILCYYDKRWFIVKYGLELVFIQQTALASDTKVYGFYSNSIVELFSGTSTSMDRAVRTKAFDFNQPQYDKQVLNVGGIMESITTFSSDLIATITAICDNASYPTQVTFSPATISYVNASGVAITLTNGSGATVTVIAAYSSILGVRESPGGRGKRVAIDFQETSSKQYVLSGLFVEGQVTKEW